MFSGIRSYIVYRRHRGSDRMVSLPITTKVMWWSLSVTCSRSVVFSGYSRFPSPIKLTTTI